MCLIKYIWYLKLKYVGRGIIVRIVGTSVGEKQIWFSINPEFSFK
jgi:hypothetical protein